MNKKKIGGYAVMTTAMASLLLTGCNEAKKIGQMIDEGEYSDAVDFYEQNNLSDKEKGKLVTILRERLNSSLEGYLAGTTKLKEVEKLMKAIDDMELDGLSDDTVDAIAKLSTYKASKQGYEDGKENEEYGNTYEAYLGYSKVIEGDCNYEKANAKATELKKVIVAEVEAEIKSDLEDKYYYSAFNELNRVYERTKMPEIKTMLDKLIGDYFKEIEENLENGKTDEDAYDNARRLINQAAYYNNWDENQKKKIEEYQAKLTEVYEYVQYTKNKERVYSNIERYLQEDNMRYYGYSSVFSAVKSFEENYALAATDTEFNQKVAQLEKDYYAYVVDDNLKKAIAQGSYNHAISELEKAISVREISDFKTLYEKCKKECPIYLTNMSSGSTSCYTKYDYGNDNIEALGETYIADTGIFSLKTEAPGTWGTDTNGTVTFTLDESYKKLSGMFDIIKPEETAEDEKTEGETTEGATTEGATTEGETTEGETTEGETPASNVYAVFSIVLQYEDAEDQKKMELEIGPDTLATKIDIDVTGANKIVFNLEKKDGSVALVFPNLKLEK